MKRGAKATERRQERIVEHACNVGPTVWSWKFARSGPAHVCALLCELDASIRSSGPKAPGHISRCGTHRVKDAPPRTVAVARGPSTECVKLGFAKARADGTVICLRPLYSRPADAPVKEWHGAAICGYRTPEGFREPGVQSSPDPHAAEPAVAAKWEKDATGVWRPGTQALIREFLVDALRHAAKHGTDEVTRAARAYLHDTPCSAADGWALGIYISGMLEGRRPWKG